MPKMHRRPIPENIEKFIRKEYGEIVWGATKEEVQMMDAFFPDRHLMAPEDSQRFTSFICIRCGRRQGEWISSWRPAGVHNGFNYPASRCPVKRLEYPNRDRTFYKDFFGERAEAKWNEVPLWYKDRKRFRAINTWRCRFGLKKLEWIEKEF